MAKVTRAVKQYEIYTLRRNFITKQGEAKTESMAEVAVFDDKVKAEAYMKLRAKYPELETDEISETFEIQPTWVEIEPVAENFNLPFSPVYEVKPEAPKPKVERLKKSNADTEVGS